MLCGIQLVTSRVGGRWDRGRVVDYDDHDGWVERAGGVYRYKLIFLLLDPFHGTICLVFRGRAAAGSSREKQ